MVDISAKLQMAEAPVGHTGAIYKGQFFLIKHVDKYQIIKVIGFGPNLTNDASYGVLYFNNSDANPLHAHWLAEEEFRELSYNFDIILQSNFSEDHHVLHNHRRQYRDRFVAIFTAVSSRCKNWYQQSKFCK